MNQLHELKYESRANPASQFTWKVAVELAVVVIYLLTFLTLTGALILIFLMRLSGA
jgi:hypothetical protein